MVKVQNPLFTEQALERDKAGMNGIARLLGTDGADSPLTEEDEQLLREAFSVVDHDDDGELLHHELDAVLHVLGARPTDAEVDEVMQYLDQDNDGDLELDDWMASVRAGKLKIQDHGAVMDLNKIAEIRQAFLHIDNDKNGMLTRDEFHAAMTLVLKGQHMDGRTAEKIWELWAAPIGDFSCELVCWVQSFSDWSTEAPELDPFRTKFIAAFSAGIAKELEIEPGRVKVVAVLPGTTKRADYLTIVADKVNLKVGNKVGASGGKSNASVDMETNAQAREDAEAESLAEYKRDICTVMFTVESPGNTRLLSAITTGNVDAVKEELDLGAPLNLPAVDTGSTPLHVAALHGHAEVCKILLDRGADFTQKNRRGNTPLKVATMRADGSTSRFEAVIEVLESFQRKPGRVRSAEVLGTSQTSSPEQLKQQIKRFRKAIRKELKKTGKSSEGLLQAQIGDCPTNTFHALKFVHFELEKVITWPDFVKGYARLRHQPLGKKLTITEVSQLSSSCMHKLIGEKEHMRALYHPEVSKLERMGIKMLSQKSKEYGDEWWHTRDTVKDEEAAQRNAELLEDNHFHGGAHVHNYTTSSPVDKQLSDFADREKNFATSTRKMILYGVMWCAFTGGLAAFVSGIGDLMAIEVYQPDAAIYCPEPTSSSAGEDCVERRFILEAFFTISVPFMIVCTTFEIGSMYYISLRNCMKIVQSVGLVLWPLDEGRVKVARRMVQAAFEISPSKKKVYGIDPLKNSPHWKIALRTLLYKAKMGATKRIVKLLVKRMMTRAGAREASTLATVSAFSMIPVGMLWNGLVAYTTTREARLRALGTMVVIKYVDKLLPLDAVHDRAGLLSNDVCKTIIRAIGCVAVAKGAVHVNSDTLLRRVHERLLHLDLELEEDDTLFEDSDGYGWGAKGFKDEDKMDDEVTFLLELATISEHDEAHAEVIFETMILACVIDGAVGKPELDLLSRTRQTIEPDDAWPDTLSDEDKKLHEDVLDSLIEERCHAWCQCIRDGGSHFGTKGDGLHLLMEEITDYHEWVKGEETDHELHSSEYKAEVRRKKLKRCCMKCAQHFRGSLCC